VPVSADAALQGAGGIQSLRVRVANGFWSRFRGLMLAKPLPQDEGLLITRCSSIHTAFMRYAIDVVYLDGSGVVLKCVKTLRPWRTSAVFARRDQKPAHCLEVGAGTIARLGIAPGDRLEHLEFAAHASNASAALAPGRGQRGAASVEFVVMAPLLALIGLSVLQFAMMYSAKNQIAHATLMAARAGSTAHADIQAWTSLKYLK
jgi:uncharacterized membrane protein (UPF0127 family)